MSRLFLDSNILIDGIVSRWSLSRAVLMLCARQVHDLVLAAYVIDEVETALLDIASSKSLSRRDAERLIDDYSKFLDFAKPEIISVKAGEPEMQQASIIRHLHDVPVLAAAIKSKPDWILSLNRKHFSPQIAARLKLRIASPLEFFLSVHRHA